MRALPWQLSFLEADPVRGEGGDPLLPGIKKKESEWGEFIQRQTAKQKRGFFPVPCGQQGGDEQSTTECGPIREAGLGVPVNEGCADTGIIHPDPCATTLFARINTAHFPRVMEARRECLRAGSLLVPVHQEMKAPIFRQEGKGAHVGGESVGGGMAAAPLPVGEPFQENPPCRVGPMA